MNDCKYLGRAKRMTPVRCAVLHGCSQTEAVFECLHPERRRRSGKAGECVPRWSGPWTSPGQEFELATLALCVECPLRCE